MGTLERVFGTFLLIWLHLGCGSATERFETKFQDWHLGCSSPDNCVLSQSLFAFDQSWLGSIYFAADGVGGTSLVVRVPSGVHLPSGIFTSISGVGTQQIRWKTCDSNGCSAFLALDPPTLTAMRAATGGHLTYRPFLEHAPMQIEFSLMGVSNGLDQLTKMGNFE